MGNKCCGDIFKSGSGMEGNEEVNEEKKRRKGKWDGGKEEKRGIDREKRKKSVNQKEYEEGKYYVLWEYFKWCGKILDTVRKYWMLWEGFEMLC